MRNNEDAKLYQKQMIEMAEESKKFIRISAETILTELDNEKLGRLIRVEMLDKIAQADAHIAYIEKLNSETKI